MNYEEMKKAISTVDLLEKDLGRALTTEEKDIVCNEGFKAFFDKIGLIDEDYALLRKCQALITTYYTGNVEQYKNLLTKYSTTEVVDDLETILRDLKENKSKDFDIETAIQNLKRGNKLTIEDPKLMDKLIEILWNSEDKVKIEVRNNTIMLR